jgi:MYXO-CTERM domain-containing protein
MKRARTRSRTRIAVSALLAGSATCAVTSAQAKPFIEYLKPTPITCSTLSSDTWGVDGVLPRDLCNGIESAKGKGVPPDYYYWDGQIIKAKDGKYHMFMSTWSGSAGFNPGWTNSDAFHAISEQGVLGPYERQGFVYTNNGSHKGHNVSALELPDGSYAVIVSEITPFTIYQSSSLDGPWTSCVATISANGVNAGTDARYESNVSLTVRHDGRFQIVQRHGLIAIADTLCGPYEMQKPTWTYPAANLPTIDSIYPRRTSIPGVQNPTYAWEEDPHIWISGGVYHVLYAGSGDRVGYHLYSPDGINDWTDNGLAFSPRLYDQIFCYEGTTTCTQWYKMERPGVVLEDGHPTHVTWAVADVDKDNQIPAGSNHGSKVIVVPLDGVAFDADFGKGGSDGAGGAAGGGGGRDGAGGSMNGGTASGGVSAGGNNASGGTASGGVSAGGNNANGGTATGGVSAGGSNASGGVPSSTTGGSTDPGGRSAGGTSASATGGSPSAAAGGSMSSSGGLTASSGRPAVGGTGGSSNNTPDSASGCGCRTASPARSSALAPGLLLAGLAVLTRRRNRSKQTAAGP